MSENTGEVDLQHPIFGRLMAKGFKLSDLLWPAIVLSLGYLSLTMYTHASDSKGDNVQLIKTLKENSAESSRVQKEISLETARVLRENNAAMAEAVRQMAEEQKKGTMVLKELACLSDPAIKGRLDARELCKRLAR